MDNCLANQGLLQIYFKCRCIDKMSQSDPLSEFVTPCKGSGLICANKIKEQMGQYVSGQALQLETEKYENIGNYSFPDLKRCLPSCQYQDNPNTMTTVQYPPEENYLMQTSFCVVASHIFQRSCLNDERRFFIEDSFPKLCRVLEDFAYLFDNTTNCNTWPAEYFEFNDAINSTLQDEVREYGKINLALLHVFHQSPYVTKIKRSVEMTFTGYVSNTGGLLGLYLGFSFVSAFEMLYWLYKFLAGIFFKTSTVNSPA